jgi:hypothetical protein
LSEDGAVAALSANFVSKPNLNNISRADSATQTDSRPGKRKIDDAEVEADARPTKKVSTLTFEPSTSESSMDLLTKKYEKELMIVAVKVEKQDKTIGKLEATVSKLQKFMEDQIKIKSEQDAKILVQ